MIVWVQFADKMRLSTISYCKICLERWFREWWWKNCFRVIVSLSSPFALMTMSLVGFEDESKISRWLFEYNLQTKWSYLRYHIAESCSQIYLEMKDGRNSAQLLFYYHLSPFLRRCLSLSVKMNGNLADYHLSEIYRQNEAIYDIILLTDVDKMI